MFSVSSSWLSRPCRLWFRATTRRSLASSSPPPAEGFLAGVGDSKFIAASHDKVWALNPELLAGNESLQKSKETKKLNLCQAVNEALSTALSSDETAGGSLLWSLEFPMETLSLSL